MLKNRPLPKPQRAPSTARAKKPPAQRSERMLLNNVSWQQYEQMIELFAENRLFMTYDEGQLELRMPLREHEEASEFLNGIINLITFLLGIKIAPLGSTTFRARHMQKGLEPDKCYYIANIEAILTKKRLDLSVHPPPDLAIEIEITSSLIPRIPIYLQLGIPELWRYDGEALTIEILQDGKYVTSKQSPAFPKLTSALLLKWMKLGESKGYSPMLHAVEAWCRKQR